MVTERGLSLLLASQSASMPVITPLALSKNNLSVGTAIGVSAAAGVASSMGTASAGTAVSPASAPATGVSTASPSSASSAASMLTGSKVSTMVAASNHVKNNLPNFFSLIKNPPSCPCGPEEGEFSVLGSPAVVRLAPFRPVALRHRLSPAMPFSVRFAPLSRAAQIIRLINLL